MYKIKCLIRSSLTVFLFGFFGVATIFVRYVLMAFNKDEMKNYDILQKSFAFFIWLLKTLKIIKNYRKYIEILK